MKKFLNISFLRRSMLFQLIIVTLIFVGIFTYLVGYRPVSGFVGSNPDNKTLVALQSTILRDIFWEEASDTPHPKFVDTELYQWINDNNPDWTYYAEYKGKILSNTTSSQFKKTLFDQKQQSLDLSAVPNIEVCEQNDLGFTNAQGDSVGRIAYSTCESLKYYLEIQNVTVPAPTVMTEFFLSPIELYWSTSRKYLIGAGAVLLFSLLIILKGGLRTIKVSQKVRELDFEDFEQVLPSEGLPGETLPLVEAINKLIKKIKIYNDRQKFFLSTAAHELRTPLAVLRTRVESLPDCDEKAEVTNDVRRVINLANSLLALMQVEDAEIPSQQVDLVALTKKIIHNRATYYLDQGIALGLETDADTVFVQGHSRLIETALSNLIDNAVTHSKSDSEVLITIKDNGLFAVRDHGQGIPEEYLSNIFEPFVKATNLSEGFGLGLAITKAIIDRHGWAISVVNAKNSGAIFRVDFSATLASQVL